MLIIVKNVAFTINVHTLYNAYTGGPINNTYMRRRRYLKYTYGPYLFVPNKMFRKCVGAI